MKANFQNKKVAVLGAGTSGTAAAYLLAEQDAKVTVLDTAEFPDFFERGDAFAANGIRFVTGERADFEASFQRYEHVVISPGIDPGAPLVQHFIRKGNVLTGEIELAYLYCQCPIIGITGTNGKTTTTQLVEKMLLGCGLKTVAAGNIGPAFSSKVSKSGELDVITLEISSFQLETVHTFHANVAVWLGFAPDHLDRYRSMDEYFAAKVRIFERQTPDDWAVVNLRDNLPEICARKITFSAYQSGGDFDLREGVIHYHGEPVLRLGETKLRGSHNAENLMAALGVGLTRGLSFGAMLDPLCSYSPLPHRCELIRTLDGVEYVNDSKATNLDSVEKALAGETHPVVLIAGGKDKGYEFDSIAELVGRKCRCAVLIGEMAERIEATWRLHVRCIQAGMSLPGAVEIARKEAKHGDVVLLSPGTSSFDMFKNYADRGDQFRQIVQNLTAL